MSISFHHLEVIDNLALVPHVISRSNYVNVEFEQFLSQRGGNAKSGRGILAVGDDEIDAPIANDARQAILDNVAPGSSENVADKQNTHK